MSKLKTKGAPKKGTDEQKGASATALQEPPARKCVRLELFSLEGQDATYLKSEASDGLTYWNMVSLGTKQSTFRDTIDRAVRQFNGGGSGWQTEDAIQLPEGIFKIASYSAKTGSHSWLANGEEETETNKPAKTRESKPRPPLRDISPADKAATEGMNKTQAIKHLKGAGYTANEIAKGMDFQAGFTYNVWHGITSNRPKSGKFRLTDEQTSALVAYFTDALLTDTDLSTGPLGPILSDLAESDAATPDFKENLEVAKKISAPKDTSDAS